MSNIDTVLDAITSWHDLHATATLDIVMLTDIPQRVVAAAVTCAIAGLRREAAHHTNPPLDYVRHFLYLWSDDVVSGRVRLQGDRRVLGIAVHPVTAPLRIQ